MVNNAGVLTVIDLATRTVIYQRLLDLDVFQGHNEGAARGVGISPVLVGKKILRPRNSGGALVLEPGGSIANWPRIRSRMSSSAVTGPNVRSASSRTPSRKAIASISAAKTGSTRLARVERGERLRRVSSVTRHGAQRGVPLQ
jgi:hypothetical protein